MGGGEALSDSEAPDAGAAAHIEHAPGRLAQRGCELPRGALKHPGQPGDALSIARLALGGRAVHSSEWLAGPEERGRMTPEVHHGLAGRPARHPESLYFGARLIPVVRADGELERHERVEHD